MFFITSFPKQDCSFIKISRFLNREISLSQTLLSTFTINVPFFNMAGCVCSTITGSIPFRQTFNISAFFRRSSNLICSSVLFTISAATFSDFVLARSSSDRSTPRQSASASNRACFTLSSDLFFRRTIPKPPKIKHYENRNSIFSPSFNLTVSFNFTLAIPFFISMVEGTTFFS